MRNKKLRSVSALPMVLLLAGCSLQRPANELYVLKVSAPPVAGNICAASIRVEDSEAATGLDSERIAVLDTPNHLTHYNGVAWAQPLPELVQAFMVDALQQSHRFKNVSSDDEDINATMLLLTDIEDFEVDNSQTPPRVRIRLVAKLADAGSHRVIATFPVDKTADAGLNHMPIIVDAFNVAINDAAADIVRGITNSCGKR